MQSLFSILFSLRDTKVARNSQEGPPVPGSTRTVLDSPYCDEYQEKSENWSLTLSKERQSSPLSSSCPHLKRFILHFNTSANSWERRLTKYPQGWKKQLLITEEPLSPPDYSLSGESFISEVVKRQVQSTDSLHLGWDTPNAQSIPAWTLTIFSHVFELASDTAMASRWGLKRTPRVYGRQSSVNYPLCICPERTHSFSLRSLR